MGRSRATATKERSGREPDDAGGSARRRIPAPLVIAVASLLVSGGAVVLVGTLREAPGGSAAPAPRGPQPAAGTPEGAALAFVNAWQTFRYERAGELSTGDAHTRVEQTVLREAAYSADQREIAEQLRQAMRSLQCRLDGHQNEPLPDGRTIVRATVRCTGAGSGEFERDDVYTLLRDQGRWKVAAWEPGTRRPL